MADTPETTHKVVKILVVEDSPTQLEALRFLVEESGFAVVTATNGKEGLAAAMANAIDLVISDIVMPEMDGYAFCKALRADETLRHLPVILLTSLADPRDVIQGLESGANNFICKPYDDRGLVARVQNVLANQEIRNAASSEMGISIFFAGQRFFITADRLQILDLLLSTYENAVNRNSELIRTRDELRVLNEQLEARVAERTAALTAEIEERKRMEEGLRESEGKYRELFDNAGDAILIGDTETAIILDANKAAETLLGRARQEIIGINRSKISPHEEEFELHVDAGRVGDVESAVIKKDGTIVPVRISAQVIDLGGRKVIQGIFRDITDRKRAEAERAKLEEKLRVSQKMEAIGSLAGGVAHDFNNLLSVILSYTGFAMEETREGDPLREDLLEVKNAADRAVALTRQLLAFSRKQVLQPVPLNLNQIAAGVEKMLRRIIGEDIELLQVLAPDLGVVRADPGQIEQVFMNLVVNARDAMPEGGKVTIETSNLELDELFATRHEALTPGSYVQLAVTDTGCGMDEQIKARLFEPFFTTKEKGKGTGLGLSTVYGIVKQSGGNISVYSEPGQGTTFKIYLPRELSATTVTAIKPPTAPRRVTGTETILVVEDEEALRKVATRTLDAAGYTVLTAADGTEALLTCTEHVGDIHLLLTDVVMPRMSGRALAQELSKTRPTLMVLYMSGYTDNAIVHHGVLDAGTHFLSKPFTATDLARKVREVLDEGVTDLPDGHEPVVKADAEKKEPPLGPDALRGLAPDVLGRLSKAVIAARFDEIVELVETIRITKPDLATGLRRMTDLFDYDGLRDLLRERKEGQSGK